MLGSGIAFLDGTVVNVALPAISKDLNTDIAGLQWVIDAYLVTLTVDPACSAARSATVSAGARCSSPV